jgi:hypothetical protein
MIEDAYGSKASINQSRS